MNHKHAPSQSDPLQHNSARDQSDAPILVGGEALIDIFRYTAHEQKRCDDLSAAIEKIPQLSLQGVAGGSPFNVAVALARLEHTVSFVGGISHDWLGDYLLSILKSEGIKDDWVTRVKAPTTVSLVGIDQHGAPAYAFYGDNAADRSLTVIRPPSVISHALLNPQDKSSPKSVSPTTPSPSRSTAPAPAHQPASIFHCGSIAATVGKSAQTYKDFAQTLRSSSRPPLITYDPNIRLSVSGNLSLWRDSVSRWSSLADVVKVSVEDINQLWPQTSVEAIVSQWQENGVSAVIVTDGEHGARMFRGDASWHANASTTSVIDSVGAGDTFQAAIIASLKRFAILDSQSLRTMSEENIMRMLNFASAASGYVVQQRGANPPQLHQIPPL